MRRVAVIAAGMVVLGVFAWASWSDDRLLFSGRAIEPQEQIAENTATISSWGIERDRWVSKVGGLHLSGEEFQSQTNLETARRALNFDLQLPTDSRATAAGPPSFWVYTDTLERLAAGKLENRPPKSQEGPTMIALYPNGFEIHVRVMNPAVYEGYFEKWADVGEGEPLRGRASTRLVRVSGLLGVERKVFFNDDGITRQAVPATITWYDAKSWAEYRAQAPEGATLTALREVVGSIY